MSIATTLFRFRIDLSDIDRGVYAALDFRVAMHPSESVPYLLTRVLAYALNFGEGLEFSTQGLHEPDGPSLFRSGKHGSTELWIEIGNPSARKVHKASKAAQIVRIYTYKDPQLMIREAAGENVHRAAEVEIFAFPGAFLNQLAEGLERDVRWQVLVNEGGLTVSTGALSAVTDLSRLTLA